MKRTRDFSSDKAGNEEQSGSDSYSSPAKRPLLSSSSGSDEVSRGPSKETNSANMDTGGPISDVLDDSEESAGSAMSGNRRNSGVVPLRENRVLPTETDEERVAILDFGAQYGKVIDRRVRELKVRSEMFPLNTTAKQLLSLGGFKAIIISGGPNSVYAENAPQVDPEIFTCGLPVLGICYGFQLMNKLHGGSVTREHIREDGQCRIQLDTSSPLFADLNQEELVLLTHGDSVSVTTVAPGFKVITNSGIHVAGISHEEKRLYGVQFHPEVDLTTNGVNMIKNFLFRIANCTGDFTMLSREKTCIEEILKTVGKKKVLVMVSGGVDSTVCAALLHKALGAERVTAIHIDNGFMRFEESDAVEKSLNNINLPVHRYGCAIKFYTSSETDDSPRLDSVIDPETKRRLIGNEFIRVKDDIMKELKLNQDEYFLAQGTLRPDLIESASSLASGHADTIKTHHNDTELVRQLRRQGRVIEPLKDFHKDEVRELGRELRLPDEIVNRHPFPGPGLAIRILCAEKAFKCEDFETTERGLNVVVNFGLSSKDQFEVDCREKAMSALSIHEKVVLTHQTFGIKATLLPIKSVGVQGDSRSYSYVAALSTSHRPIPWTILFQYAAIIPKLFHNINRVAYVFGDPVRYPVQNVTHTTLARYTIAKLQNVDKVATDVLFGRVKSTDGKILPDVGLKIQQMPVILIPVDFDRDEELINSYRHSVVLRPFITSDFMTGTAAVPNLHLPEETVLEMAKQVACISSISRVLLDMTSKPPGTTEWE